MQPKTITLTGVDITISDVVSVTASGSQRRRLVNICDKSLARMTASFDIVLEKLAKREVIYGVTTGFGELANVAIDADQSANLQRNLILSHACGVGAPFSEEIVRAIMLLRANALASGFSGVSPRCVQILTDMLNVGITPVVPMKGSLGASGDLCHLAHIAMVMIGKGEASYGGKIIPGGEALKKANITPLSPIGKDGLGLINGTQAMSAIGVFCVHDAERLIATATAAAALSLEALRGCTDAFDADLHAVRPHAGQVSVAADMRRLLVGSKNTNTGGRVQDAYSLRCVPQVHGASLDALAYVKNVVEKEINSVTDNPIVIPEAKKILSGGNFHGQPLALALDFLGVAMAEIANISERRTERLVNHQLSGLPGFLTKTPGINSGMMIAQYTAACLVSENKVYAHPASVDSIPSSANQEDHVSMGAISARKCAEIISNVKYVLAIELMAAAQAVDLGVSKETLGANTRRMYDNVRTCVTSLDCDRPLHKDIETLAALVECGGVFN